MPLQHHGATSMKQEISLLRQENFLQSCRIWEGGSYLNHNKGTGRASCSVSLQVVTTLHLSWARRLSLRSLIQTRRVQPEFKRKGEKEVEERDLLPPVSVTPHLLALAPLIRDVVGLTAGRLQTCGRDWFLSTTLMFETSELWKMVRFVCLQGIWGAIFDSASGEQGNTCGYQRCRLGKMLHNPPGQWQANMNQFHTE